MFFNIKNNKIRKALIVRKTTEVDISGEFIIDGSGKTSIKTPFEPLNHLLTLLCFHGFFDLTLSAKGDLAHHIVEDIGIALGKTFKEALSNKIGINRYGSFSLVMDKVVVEVNVDISGRPGMFIGIPADDREAITQLLSGAKFDDTNFDYEDAKEFLESFTQHAGISLACFIKSGEGDLHHILEALFKAFGKALDQAVRIDFRRQGVPSTKGIID